MRVFSVILLGFLSLGAGACSRAAGDAKQRESALIEEQAAAGAAPIDVERAMREPAELLRAARTRQAGLGAHRFAGTSTLRVSEKGAEVELLVEETSLEIDAKGQYHARYGNSRDYGREIYHSAGKLWLRSRYGKFHRRPPIGPEEPIRLADETLATFGAQLELVAHTLELTDAGPVTLGGRAARKVGLALGKATNRPTETLPQRGWRETIRVAAVSGELTLDTNTGALLDGRLQAKLTFVRGAHTYEMVVDATHAITDVGSTIEITPPGDELSVDTPGRSTDFDDREELLDGIAPPARRSPTPQDLPAPGPRKDKDKAKPSKAKTAPAPAPDKAPPVKAPVKAQPVKAPADEK